MTLHPEAEVHLLLLFRSLLFLLLVRGWAAAQFYNQTQVFAQARAARIAHVQYDLALAFREHADDFSGTVTISFDLKGHDEDLALDFAGKSLTRASCNGQAFQPLADPAGTLTLRAGLLREGTNAVSIEFLGNYANNGRGLHRYIDPVDGLEYLYTDLQPNMAMRVFPCFDQPDLRASFRLQLTLPSAWVASANGPLLTAQRQADRSVLRFKPTKPIATYLFNLVAGAYALWQDDGGPVPMRLFCRQSLADYLDADKIFETTRAGLAFFNDYFAMDYPFEKYDQAFVPEYNYGAMENPGSVVFNEYYVLGFSPSAHVQLEQTQVILHEMAHMWFGDLVTMTWWHDLWLNESFASYMELVGLRGLGQEDTWRILAEEQEDAFLADQRRSAHAIVAPVPDVRAAVTIFDAITYKKGQAVLRQLEYRLGQERFRDGIRRYLRENAWKNATLGDFFAAMEQTSGEDLSRWRALWLETAGVNRIEPRLKIRKGRIVKANLIQERGSGAAVLRPHKLLLGLFRRDEDGRVVLADSLPVTIDGQRAELPQLIGQPAPLFIQPNLYEYSFVKAHYDPSSLDWLRDNLEEIEDDGFRYQVWMNLWDMVRDGRFKAREYFVMGHRRLSGRPDQQTITLLADKLKTIAQEYIPDPDLAALMENQLFKLAREGLTAGDTPEPQRLEWLELLLATARSDSQLDYLAALLAGTLTLDGLELEATEDWPIAATLIEQSRPPDEETMRLLGEQARADIARAYRPMSAALQPNAQAKAAAWRDITENPNLSLDHKRWLMAGFYSRHQHALLQPYTAAYFQELESAYHHKEWEFTHAFAEMMFPKWAADEALTRAAAFLARPGLPAELRLLVLEQVDERERIAAIRNANR